MVTNGFLTTSVRSLYTFMLKEKANILRDEETRGPKGRGGDPVVAVLDCYNNLLFVEMKCDLCGNRDGPCGQEDSSRHSFYIQFRKNFKDHLNVPCFARKKFNSVTDDMLFVETEGRDLYAFELDKTKHKTRICGGQYDEFLVEYNMDQGNRIKLDMDNEPQYLFMYPMDKYGQVKDRVLEEFVFQNTATTIVYSKNFQPTGSEMARMNRAATKHGLGIGVVFVHTMTNSDINKNMMHIPKAITPVLDIPWNGKAKLVMDRFGIVKRAKCYKSKDGRLQFKRGWPEFADKANLQIGEGYLIMFDIVEDKLVIYVDPVCY